MIYVGDDYLLHATGKSYDYTKHIDQYTPFENTTGGIMQSNVSTCFDSDGDRYLFDEDVTSFCVLRPLNKTGLSYTEDAINRFSIPYVTIEKVNNKNYYASVNSNEELTYTITLVNNGPYTLSNIKVCDKIPNDCTFVSINNNGINDNGSLSWNVSLTSGQTLELIYKVKLNANLSVGTNIISECATVNGVKTNSITNIVTNLTSVDLSNFTDNAINSKTYSTVEEYINDIYNEIYEMNNVLDCSSLSNNTGFLKNLLKLVENSSSEYCFNEDSQFVDLLIPGFYGGYKFEFSGNMIREVRSSYLETGDIISYYDANTKTHTTYLYIDSETIVGLNSSGNVEKVYDSETDVNSFLESLISYQRYAILRPSIYYSVTE